MSAIASHSPLNILEIVGEAWFKGTTNRKYGLWGIKLTSRDPERSNSWPQYA